MRGGWNAMQRVYFDTQLFREFLLPRLAAGGRYCYITPAHVSIG